MLGRADHHYVSQSTVSLAQGLQMAILRLASLENRLALLDPFHGGHGAEKDFLGLEAASAGVYNYPAWTG